MASMLYQLLAMNSRDWILMTCNEMKQRARISRDVATVHRYFLKLQQEYGFIESRKNPRIQRDQTREYRLNLEKIEAALTAAGYTLESLAHFTNFQSASCIIKERSLKPLRSLKTKKLNDKHIHRARESDPDSEIRKEYHKFIRDKETCIDPDSFEMTAFAMRETKRVSRAMFGRAPDTPGETALVQVVVDGDIPLSWAAAIPELVNLREISHRSVFFAALLRFKDVFTWKKMTHPIRYLAKCVENAITDDFLDHATHREAILS